MKTLKSFAVFFFLTAFLFAGYSQGKKSTYLVPYPWNENVVPIECIGPYDGTINMEMTFFDTGKVLNKASGEITDADGNDYTIESLFNCHLFVRNISASGNSNQAMTFRVRSKDTGKLVATVHFTWHYENWAGEGDASLINIQTVCH